MQFSELYTDRLDEELGTDDSTRLFTTARRKFAINEGIRQFADLTECFTKESSLTCSNGVGEYSVFSTVNMVDRDFIRLSKQEPEYRLVSSNSTSPGSTQYVSGKDFRRTTVQWLDEYEPGWRNSTGGTPQFYYERVHGTDRVIGLYPPPKVGSSEAGTLRVPYVARPSSLSDDTHVPFYSTASQRHDLHDYDQAYVHFAAHRLEKLRVQPEESGQQLQAFLGYVQRFLGALRPKGGTTVRTARNYFGDARSRRPSGGVRAWRTDLYGDR